MAQTPVAGIHPFLGFTLWGDLGPLTMYKSHQGRLVVFKKTWPDRPPTPPQVAQRDAMTLCGRSWQALPAHHKHLWRRVADQASLTMSGYNLWTSWRFRQDYTTLATLERQTRIQLFTAATTATTYDQRYRNRQTRKAKSQPDPHIYAMPRSSREKKHEHISIPVITPGVTSTFWYEPISRALPYRYPLKLYVNYIGPGVLVNPPAYNQMMIPLIFTPPPYEFGSVVGITILWPDGTFTSTDIVFHALYT